MFNKTKAVVQEVVDVAQNVEVVRELVIRGEGARHLLRRHLQQWRPELRIEGIENVAHMVLTAQQALRLKHIALYYEEKIWQSRSVLGEYGLNRPIFYTGDLPEFVLDRVDQAKAAGINIFTVHSNLVLPVQYIRSDPIMLGWFTSPQFTEQKIIGKWVTNNPSALGIVLAIWDNDKELEA